jgi:hypothetical protein
MAGRVIPPATIPRGKATEDYGGMRYMGAVGGAVLACVTATLLVLPLLLPPLPPPPLLFMLVPVAIFAVLVSLVLVPSDAAPPSWPPTCVQLHRPRLDRRVNVCIN